MVALKRGSHQPLTHRLTRIRVGVKTDLEYGFASLIVLIDDAGPGLPTTFGGEVHTPTMDRIVGQGIAYNRFHATAMCSPTRASLLTGRNHHRVGNGQIAELANDWDGYAGTIPRSSALAAEVLKDYGYSTCAFGKWHNTPAMETTAAGPFENWPTGLGCRHKAFQAEKPFQRRLMEVAAGYAEHVDVQAGRLIEAIEALGYGENTLIFYIWGDNGSSSEGKNGTVSELPAQNGIPTTVKQHIAALDALGGLDVLGSALTDNQYHGAWAWAGSTPYKGTKLPASYFGGTRNPMAIRWPSKIKPDATPRPQFHHCNDLVPTIYEILGINPPREVNGVPQDPIDGVSFAYSFDAPKAEGRLVTQYFEIMGSRGIYHDGWLACALGPRLPWVPGTPPGIREWTPDKDVWELYNLAEDWTQANDLAAKMPEKLAQMKELFLIEAAKNKALPIGGGLWVPVMHPELRLARPNTEWNFTGDITRMPEFTAPALGNKPNLVTIEADIPTNANGVLYKLGANSGGLTLFVEDGILCYEYNLFIVMRTKIRATQKLPAGRARIELETVYVEPKPGGPLKVTLKVNGKLFATGAVPVSAPLLSTANDCLDIGIALGSPVSLDYREKAPFKFNGTMEKVNVKYIPQPAK